MHWPHIEADGIVCALPESATHNPYDPVSVLDRLLGETASLIDECSQGLRMEDFQSEFLSYWSRTVNSSSTKIVSLMLTFESSRLIAVWRGTEHYLIADTGGQAAEWLRRRYADHEGTFLTEEALLVTLARPLFPHEYPMNALDVLRVIRERCSSAMGFLSAFISRRTECLLVIFYAPTQNGPAIAGVKISLPVASNVLGRKTEPMTQGFRPGKVPIDLSLARYFGSKSRLERVIVERADAMWIHGRDHDIRTKQLHNSKVAIFGIGSIGSFVAEHLAAAGVGNLILIDPETLTFANTGRHLLGADNQGKPKALEVAKLLRRRFPHHHIEYFCMTAQEFIRENKVIINGLDLVVSVTGNWETDTFVNDRYVQALLQRVLFGWTEPHAVAGHAVLLTGRDSCLCCHFDAAGRCDLRISQWDEETYQQEPACGGIFQPYGPVEIAMTNAMIASVALEALCGKLTGSVHRVYATDQKTIGELGGRYTDKWRELMPSVDDDLKISKTLLWRSNPECLRCGGKISC